MMSKLSDEDIARIVAAVVKQLQAEPRYAPPAPVVVPVPYWPNQYWNNPYTHPLVTC